MWLVFQKRVSIAKISKNDPRIPPKFHLCVLWIKDSGLSMMTGIKTADWGHQPPPQTMSFPQQPPLGCDPHGHTQLPSVLTVRGHFLSVVTKVRQSCLLPSSCHTSLPGGLAGEASGRSGLCGSTIPGVFSQRVWPGSYPACLSLLPAVICEAHHRS